MLTSENEVKLIFVLQQSADGDAQTLTEVDLFISTQRIKVLNADSQVSTRMSVFCTKCHQRGEHLCHPPRHTELNRSAESCWPSS